MTHPKVILLNGFAGAGKTTIARMYIKKHPMAMAIEEDELIVNIGDWLAHENEARNLVFELIKAMLSTYLSSGHDVVLPHLVTDASKVQAYESIAKKHRADFYEFVLYDSRPEAISRLLQRGAWGEAGQPPLTDKDLPVIEGLHTKMENEIEKRPNMNKINLKDNDPEGTYRQIISYLRK